MATTGKTAWDKYFTSAVEIKTALRKDSTKYDPDTLNTIGKVNAGTNLTFINEGVYQSKALVKEGKELYRVQFDKLAKPGNKASNRADLKPQAFGIKEQEYSFDQVRDIALKTLEERDDLSGEVKVYLELLLLYHSEGENITTTELSEAYTPIKTQSSTISAIINDYGELLGPFGVFAHDLMTTATNRDIIVPRNAKLWFPARPNEPLMDYGIYVGTGSSRRLLTISAKALSKTTNVVKPGDILNLLNKSEGKVNMKRKWERKIQYKILNILNDNSIAAGPPLAVAYLVDNIPAIKRKHEGVSIKAAEDMAKNGKNYDTTLWTTFTQTNTTVLNRPNKKGKIDAGVIRYACEKILQEESKGNGILSMRDIFADSIANKVFYVKFTINSSGLPDWAISTDKDFRSNSNVMLRTKNGYTRGGDRMGVQP
jgi:hypothetical protein